MLGFGFWVLGFGFWVLGFKVRVQALGFQLCLSWAIRFMLDTKAKTRQHHELNPILLTKALCDHAHPGNTCWVGLGFRV